MARHECHGFDRGRSASCMSPGWNGCQLLESRYQLRVSSIIGHCICRFVVSSRELEGILNDI
jgi:hypothetical protein